MRNLSPGEALPDRKAKRNSRIKVSTRRRATGYDSEGDTNGISPSNLEDRAKSRLRTVDKERGLGSNARITALHFSLEHQIEVPYQCHILTRRRRHQWLPQASREAILAWRARSLIFAGKQA